jgi:hypothetical protein
MPVQRNDYMEVQALMEVESDERHALMPLDLAAEVIRQKVYPQAVVRSLTREQLLDSIAATISVVARIYEYDPKGATAPRPLSRVELDGGMFKGGAKDLRFIDGRATRSTLAVTAQDIAQTIEALRGATA